MPVPLNPFVDVVRSWFTEKLGYLVNDSVPVKPEYIGKPNTASDIDLVCKHPRKHQQLSLNGRTVKLSSNVIVECKGWFEYSKTGFVAQLIDDLTLLNKYKTKYLPKVLPKAEHHFFFLREEVYKKGIHLFGTNAFQRMIIGPFLVPSRTSRYDIPELISKYESKGIIIIEMKDIVEDLFHFIQNAIDQKKRGVSSDDADKLRKTYALEMLHLVNTYCKVERKNEI